MRLLSGVLVLSALGCGAGDDGGLPVGGVPTDGNGIIRLDSGTRDAARDAPPDGTVLAVDANLFNGRVCLLTDPRVLDVCASTGAGGLTVRLGEATATTTDDGSFTIEGQSGSGLVWRITGANIKSSFEPLADYFIPAITRTAFNSMLSGATPNVMEVPGEGSIMVFISYNGGGASGHTVTTTPAGFYQPYYDGTTPSGWQQTSTNGNGVAWVPALDVGSVTLQVSGGSSVTAPIFDDGITFANVLLPAP